MSVGWHQIDRTLMVTARRQQSGVDCLTQSIFNLFWWGDAFAYRLDIIEDVMGNQSLTSCLQIGAPLTWSNDRLDGVWQVLLRSGKCCRTWSASNLNVIHSANAASKQFPIDRHFGSPIRSKRSPLIGPFSSSFKTSEKEFSWNRSGILWNPNSLLPLSCKLIWIHFSAFRAFIRNSADNRPKKMPGCKLNGRLMLIWISNWII